MTSKMSVGSKKKSGKKMDSESIKILESLQKIKRRQREIKKMRTVEKQLIGRVKDTLELEKNVKEEMKEVQAARSEVL